MIPRYAAWTLVATLVAASVPNAMAQQRRSSRHAPARAQRVLAPPVSEEPATPATYPDLAPLEYAKEEAVRGGLLPRWFSGVRVEASIETGYTYNDRDPGNSRPLKKPDGFVKHPNPPTRSIIRIPGRPGTPDRIIPPSNGGTINCGNIGAPINECGPGFGEFRPVPPERPTVIPGESGTEDQIIVVETPGGPKRNWKDLKDGRIRSGENVFRVFDRRHNAGMVNAIRFRVVKDATEESPVGFSFRILGGKDSEVVESGEQTIDQVAAQEAMGTFRIPGKRGIKVSAGRMPSKVGAEVIEARENFNQSRGLLFALMHPLTVEGSRVEAPITEKISFSGGVLRGWDNSVEGEDDGGTGEAKLTYKPTERTTISGAAMSGNAGEKDTGGGQRHLLDFVVRHRFSDTAEGYINATYVTQDGQRNPNLGFPGGRGDAHGVSAGFRKQFGKRLLVASRLEYLDDPDGSRSGFRQTLGSATVTGEYRFTKRLIGRVEFRHDTSTESAFVSDRRPVSNQNTVSFNFLWSF